MEDAAGDDELFREVRRGERARAREGGEIESVKRKKRGGRKKDIYIYIYIDGRGKRTPTSKRDLSRTNDRLKLLFLAPLLH